MRSKTNFDKTKMFQTAKLLRKTFTNIKLDFDEDKVSKKNAFYFCRNLLHKLVLHLKKMLHLEIINSSC